MSENFLSFSKGVKDPFEVQEGRYDFPGEAAAEKASLHLEGIFSLFFSSCCRSLSSYNGELRDPLVCPKERPVSM